MGTQPSREQPALILCVPWQALDIAHQSRRVYEDVTAGIIFLGTPHLISDEGDGWNNLKLIMKGNRKDISKENMTEDDKNNIISVGQRFDELRLGIPILSVYEAVETKLRENILHAFRPRNKSSVVVR